MKKLDTTTEIQNPCCRFGLAVALFVMGILGFSAWPYFVHRQILEQAGSGEAVALEGPLRNVVLIESYEGIFMCLMAFLLVILYHRARVRNGQQKEQLNRQLRNDFQRLKKHDSELEDAMRDLERFNALATGREERIIELKTEVNELLMEMDRSRRYDTAPKE